MKPIHINSTGSVEGKTIVFLHGNSSSSRVFSPILKSNKLPYNLISFDFPGHGKSHKVDGGDSYTIIRYIEVLLDVIPQNSDTILVGNSFGGHIAMEAVKDIPGLKGLVIFGAPPLKLPLNIEEALMPTDVIQYYFTDKVTNEQLDKLVNTAVHNKDIAHIIKEDFRSCDPVVRSMLQKELGTGVALSNEAELFKHMDVPRLILHGRNDVMVNLNYLEQIIQDSHGDAEISIIDECGHYPSLERPNSVTNEIKKFASKIF